jgi:hypothetical protein
MARLIAAATFILATCRTENPPELVAQSRPGSAPQKGQRKDSGLTGRISPGIEALSFDIS